MQIIINQSIKNEKKCRECASRLCSRVLTTKNSFVWLCVKCTNEKNGFNQLCSRNEIFKSKNGFRPKQKILNFLTLAKKGMSGKHLYWKHQIEHFKNSSFSNRKRVLPF